MRIDVTKEQLKKMKNEELQQYYDYVDDEIYWKHQEARKWLEFKIAQNNTQSAVNKNRRR